MMPGILHNGTIVGGTSGQILYSADNHTGEWSNDRLNEYNCYNYLPHLADQTIDSDGLTGNVTNDVITVAGETTGPYFINYYYNVNDLPDWFIPGTDIYLVMDKTGSDIVDLGFRIIYVDGNGDSHTFGTYNRTQNIHIPLDFDGVGLVVRFYVPTGRTVNGSVRLQLLNAMSNLQLTQLANQKDVISNPPMLTLTDDDGNVKFYTDLLPLIESRGVPITSCVIPYRADNPSQFPYHMTWEQIEDANRRGADIISHSYDHMTWDIMQNKTEQEIWLNYQKARNTLESHGCMGGQYMAYSGATSLHEVARNAGKKACRCAYGQGEQINYRGTIDPYNIMRYRLQREEYDLDPEKIKPLVDKCLTEGGWMVWIFHTSETVWTTKNGLSAITECIDYAISQGLPIVNTDVGYKTYIL